jgi:hypothetical protein
MNSSQLEMGQPTSAPREPKRDAAEKALCTATQHIVTRL